MIIEEAQHQWRSKKPYRHRPAEQDTILWQKDLRTLYLESSWGPAVPYQPLKHPNGAENHGYLPLKGSTEALSTIPELKGYPELEEFIRVINSAETPIESVGCERALRNVENNWPFTAIQGSYVDIVFTEAKLNQNPENHMHLAIHFLEAVENCHQWYGSVEAGIQPFRGLKGVREPWGLMLRITNQGRDAHEARKLWGATLAQLAQAATKIPAFKF